MYYKPNSHESIFIYDWDDTLLTLNFLSSDMKSALLNSDLTSNGAVPCLSACARSQLAKLDQMVVRLLKLSMSYGQTFIIVSYFIHHGLT